MDNLCKSISHYIFFLAVYTLLERYTLDFLYITYYLVYACMLVIQTNFFSFVIISVISAGLIARLIEMILFLSNHEDLIGNIGVVKRYYQCFGESYIKHY